MIILKNQIGGNFSREQVLQMMINDFTNYRSYDYNTASFARFLVSKQEELDDIYINYNTAFILACDIDDSINLILYLKHPRYTII